MPPGRVALSLLKSVCGGVVVVGQTEVMYLKVPPADVSVDHPGQKAVPPESMIVQSLIKDGCSVGMSTRSLGKLIQEERSSVNKVKDMRLVAVDCVADPSFGEAFVNGILESKQYVVNKYGQFEEAYDNFEKTISTMPLKGKDDFLRKHMLQFIKNL